MICISLRPFLRARIEAQPDVVAEPDSELEALNATPGNSSATWWPFSAAFRRPANRGLEHRRSGAAGRFHRRQSAVAFHLLRQELLETADVRKRLETLIRELSKELEVLELRNKIHEQVQEQVGQSQREYLLREQMKAIQKELGESDDSQAEIDELRKKLDESGMPAEARKECDREIKRLQKMTPASAEYMVVADLSRMDDLAALDQIFRRPGNRHRQGRRRFLTKITTTSKRSRSASSTTWRSRNCSRE